MNNIILLDNNINIYMYIKLSIGIAYRLEDVKNKTKINIYTNILEEIKTISINKNAQFASAIIIHKLYNNTGNEYTTDEIYIDNNSLNCKGKKDNILMKNNIEINNKNKKYPSSGFLYNEPIFDYNLYDTNTEKIIYNNIITDTFINVIYLKNNKYIKINKMDNFIIKGNTSLDSVYTIISKIVKYISNIIEFSDPEGIETLNMNIISQIFSIITHTKYNIISLSILSTTNVNYIIELLRIEIYIKKGSILIKHLDKSYINKFKESRISYTLSLE